MKYSLIPLAAAAALASAESAPAFTATSVTGVLVEQFQEPLSQSRWSPSKATKEERNNEVFSYRGQWSVEEPTVYPGIVGDTGLVMKTKAAHHAISAPFEAPLDPAGKPLIVSYEVKLQQGLSCGGAYVKLLTDSPEGIQAEEFSDKTPYTLMFGPDRCGATSKTHLIIRRTSPITGEVEEKHLISPPPPKVTKTSALYTLIIRPDQTYEILINNESAKKGSLLDDFSPAFNPPTEIDDETDVKPDDWVELPKISDPDAVKPDDWDEDAPQSIEDPDAVKPADWLEDEPTTVPDPDAEKPEEWSDEDDGDWIAPSVPNPTCATVSGCGPWKRPEIPNPEYKGKWFAPLIDNPDYKGPWAPRKIANPNYYEDENPAGLNKIAGVGFELWSMDEDILFDNIYIGQSEADLAQFISETYAIKAPVEAALEKADKPEPEHKHDHAHGAEPDYKAQPVEWLKFKAKQFVDEAAIDPKRAFVERPLTGGVVGVVFATVVGLLGVLISLLLPSSAQAKVSSAATAAAKKADAVATDASAKIQEVVDDKVAPVAEAGKKKVDEAVEGVKEGVRTRAKAKKQDEASS
ncbi:hypothetical protein JCM10207_008036 [Rhodosporidiobolus poonsookiae]